MFVNIYLYSFMKNFVYCFDENYNIQGYCSIMSLLKNCEKKINIYVVHQNPQTFVEFAKIIKSNKFLDNLKLYKFENKNYNFPNLKNKHVSEATYYRLFLDQYLPTDIDSFIYLDADAFFINKFTDLINTEIEKLKSSNFTIAALNSKTHFNYKRLGLKNRRYFNAGVLLVDYKKWLEKKVSLSFMEILKTRKNDLMFWDQDILNIYFDGNFYNLDESLNFNVYGDQKSSKEVLSNIINNAVIIHYSGKYKPWSPKGVLAKESKFFNTIYKELFNKNYLIVNIFSTNTLKILLSNIFSFRILKLDHPISYIYLSLLSVINKEKLRNYKIEKNR